MLRYSLKKSKILFVFFAVFLTITLPAFRANAITAVTDEYAPRPAKDGRTVFIHGDFSKNGTNTSVIVIPDGQKGNSKTVSVGANSHSAAGAWDSIEMDCFNPERGYYKTTLRLKGGLLYQFKMEQKNSAGIKDVWYGLDGYMSRFPTDAFNGGSDANINLYLKHDDDVTFFFIDGDRGSFVEWQPAPPHQTENQPGTKFHLITVSTKIRNNLQGIEQNGSRNNIFDNNSGGSWRWRDPFSPVWYSLISLPESGEISQNGNEISAAGALYMFRRTDAGEIGMYGKWQLDNDIENPARDKNSDYWKNAGAFFSQPENAPRLYMTGSNGEAIPFPLAYAADEKQPRHEEGANNIIFEGAATVETAGVYTYYLDEMNLDGTLTDDAQNFTAYPRPPAQSVYLPSLTLDSIAPENGKNEIALSGQVYGHNKWQTERNTVYVMLTAREAEAESLTALGFEKKGETYQKIYTVSADSQGVWRLALSLPGGRYAVKAFADVYTPQLIDPQARNFSKELYSVENTEGINDLNAENTYAGQFYLQDFIAERNAENLYSDFGEAIPAPDSQIYEVNGEQIPVAIGTGFAAGGESGTHTRSGVANAEFVVIESTDKNALDVPKTSSNPYGFLWLTGSISGFAVGVFLIVRKKRRGS